MPLAGKRAGSLVVILGPTAVGKTTLSLNLAERFNGEIVSADSRQVYRGMNIGAAKPSDEEQTRVPHHLIDLVDPDQTLSLAQYQNCAYQTIDEILSRGRLPFLVGGTGQYLSAVIEGWAIPETPPNEPLRRELEAYAAEQGSQALHDRLKQLDPTAAERIHPNNVRRVVRALEVCLETGCPISKLQRKSPPPYRILQVGLRRPRDELYARIDTRIDQMMHDDLLQEVRALLDAGYDHTLPAMSGLGYIQLSRYIIGENTLEEALAAIRHDTRAFARRQETWFRKYNHNAHWFKMTDATMPIIIELISSWLNEQHDATT